MTLLEEPTVNIFQLIKNKKLIWNKGDQAYRKEKKQQASQYFLSNPFPSQANLVLLICWLKKQY